MRRLIALSLLVLAACVAKKDAPADTTVGDSGAGADTTTRVTHKIAYKSAVDTIYDEQGNWCLIHSKVHFMEVNVGDIKADYFCKWQAAK